MTGDIDSQTAQFADIEKIKIDSHFADFEQIMIDPHSFFLLTLGRSQNLLSLGKTTSCEKQFQPSPFDKKFKNDA